MLQIINGNFKKHEDAFIHKYIKKKKNQFLKFKLLCTHLLMTTQNVYVCIWYSLYKLLQIYTLHLHF